MVLIMMFHPVVAARRLFHCSSRRRSWRRRVDKMLNGARGAPAALVGALLVSLASPAMASPISGPSGFLTLADAQALARAGALSWGSDRELVAAFFFDPVAGRAPTIHSRWSILSAGDDNRAAIGRHGLDAITCGRLQIDLEQYNANGLDYSTLLVLF